MTKANDAEREKMKARIAKLLALGDTERNSNVAQAVAATARAARLMMEYNITQEEAEAAQAPKIGHEYVRNDKLHRWDKRKPIPPRPDKRKDWDAYFAWYLKYGKRRDWVRIPEHGFTSWYIRLAERCASLAGCECPYFNPHGCTFVGDHERVKMAAFLMSNIYSRMMDMADQAVKEYTAKVKTETGKNAWTLYGRDHPNAYKRGFIEGLADGISSKIWEIWFEGEKAKREKERRERKRNKGQENPLAVARRNALADYKSEHFGWIELKISTIETKTKEADERYRVSGDGISAGYEAGGKFQLQHGVDQSTGKLVALIEPPPS